VFERTLRIPDDGRVYPLPPGLGEFPIKRVRDYARRVPAAWRERGGYFIPMHQREALWIYFDAPFWRPNAVKVGVGGVNAVSGQPWDTQLRQSPQDYLVVPDQPWLDGINAGDGFIRQFVAMPLGSGYTVEGQVTGAETEGGIQLVVFEPKPGRFPDRPPRAMRGWHARCATGCVLEAPGDAMGLGAGGRMRQEIYPDEYGIETWDLGRSRTVNVRIVNSEVYREITGEAPPPTPVSARTYTEYGFPWFDLYDEGRGDVAPSPVLAGVKSVSAIDGEKGGGPQAVDAPVGVPPWQVITLG
jgi:hypothetical protein